MATQRQEALRPPRPLLQPPGPTCGSSPVGLEHCAPQGASARPDVYVRQRGQGGTSTLTTLMHSKRVSRPSFAHRTCGVRRLATAYDMPGLMAAQRLATAGRSLRHPRISRSVGADSPRSTNVRAPTASEPCLCQLIPAEVIELTCLPCADCACALAVHRSTGRRVRSEKLSL